MQNAPAPATGLDDPKLYDGFNSPLLPHVAGTFDLDVTGYSGAKGYESGKAVHITFTVKASTNAEVQPGQTYRVFYKYDYERNEPIEGLKNNQGLVHAKLLGQFLSALAGKHAQDASFSKKDMHSRLMRFDLSASPLPVQLQASTRDVDCPVDGGGTRKEPRRRDLWLPAVTAK